MSVHADRYVVLVLPALTMGGMEKQLLTVFEGAPEYLAQHRVEILTFIPEGHPLITERLTALSIPVTTIDRGAMSFPRFFVELVAFFRRAKPGIVHAFLAGSTATWGRLAAWVAGVRVIMLSDLSLNPTVTRTQRMMAPLTRRITSRFITNAQATVERLMWEGVPSDKIRLLRNALNLELYDPGRPSDVREDWGAENDDVIVGFLGMLRNAKRPDLFLESVLRLDEGERPDLVVIAGDGPLMPEVREYVEQDGWLRKHCKILGVVEDVPAFLQGIDVLALTSDTESLPNAIMEAMAAAVPCVATRVADVPMLIGDERFLADPGDADSIAAALAKMLSLEPSERGAIGSELRERAAREFDLVESARRFWELHEDLWPRSLPGTPR